MVARRRDARAPRDRRAIRHDLGGGQRPGARRRDAARLGTRPRQRHRHRHREARRHAPGPRSRSAASRRFAATTAICRAASTSSNTRCGSPTPAASRCRRRASRRCTRPRLRRDAECGARGRAMKRLLFARCSCSALASPARCAAPRCRRSTRSRPRTGRRTWCCSTATACRSRPCASTRPCAGCRGCRSPDMSPALLQALVLSEDRNFYEHCGVDWGALAQERMEQRVEHAHARRVDADDAARGPAGRRARPPGRRAQRRRRRSARR